MSSITLQHQEALRRLALNDEGFVASILTRYSGVAMVAVEDEAASSIDDRTRRLVDLAAVIAVGSGPVGIDAAVNAAFGAGATADDVVEVLFAIAPVVGTGRVVSCAQHVAAAIGYDLDGELERLHAS